MTVEQRFLTHLLACTINNEAPKCPNEKISWEIIWDMADKQKILPLIFDTVRKLEKEYQPPREMMVKWGKITLDCALFFAFQAGQIKEVLSAAEEKGIDVLVLKGMAIRELYPTPELRTMSDCDVMIKPDKIEQTKEVFLRGGYHVSKTYKSENIYTKEGALTFEVFHKTPPALRSSDGTDFDIWKNTTQMLGNHIFKPSTENMLIHSVLHLMKHLKSRGTGIRNLADIVLLLKSSQLDWDSIINRFELLKADKLFYGLLLASERYFGYKNEISCPEIDEGFVDRLMTYMLSSSVYGNMENEYILDARKAEGRKKEQLRNYFHKIFPSLKNMADKYNYVKKMPILLPVAWIHRIITVVFLRKKSIADNIKSMRSATSAVDEQMDILRYFEIKD
ncbi:MAG: nucleotidyltransferase family protein [Monoglobales bacterium]